jgi:hypothetical protein
MKTWSTGGVAPPVLTSALDGGWLGPTAGLDDLGKRNPLSPLSGIEYRPPLP